MKRLFLLLALLPVLPTFAIASPATEPFAEQISIIENISPYVERTDLARLMVVRNAVGAVVADMEKNVANGKKEVTFQTLRLVQNLIIQYRFSQVFFGWTDPISLTSIYTEATADQLARLKSLSENMVDEYGYDDSPYTQITANTFRQMQRLLKQLEDLPMSPELQQQLRALWQPIGETISVAEQGDRPKTFAKAIPLVEQIRTLYPLFDQVSTSDAGFPMVLELQGLAEFYVEYAQMEEGEE